MPTIFIVDDDYDILLSLKAWFERKEYTVATFEEGRNLISHIIELKPHLVLLDINLKGEDGRYVCRDIKEQVPYPIKVLLFSANPLALLTYQDNLADGIVHKPFDLEALEEKCRKLLAVNHKWFE